MNILTIDFISILIMSGLMFIQYKGEKCLLSPMKYGKARMKPGMAGDWSMDG